MTAAGVSMLWLTAESVWTGPLYEASMRPPAYGGPATRILSWNVAGLRSLLKKASCAQLVWLRAADCPVRRAKHLLTR